VPCQRSGDCCNPSRPVPAIVFHGTDDPIVPFEGGLSGPNDLPLPAIPEWVSTLASRNQCSGTPEDLSPIGVVSGVLFANCAADVVSYTVAGGGHTWPGGEAIPELIAGPTTQDIDATQLMWDFFQRHPLPEE
jgi:polyhydroxybutyrate depolymerase